MCKKIIAFVLIIISLSIYAQKGYEIQVTIRGLKDTTLVLGHHFGSSIYPDDTTKLDGNGRGVFKKKKDLPGGMYVIYLPNKTYFDIIVNNENKFSVENDTSDLFKNIKFKNSKENELFYAYQNFLAAQRSEMQKLSEKYKASKDDKEKESIRKQIEITDKKVAINIDSIYQANPNSFAAKFIRSTKNLEVPDPPRNAEGKMIDSNFQYKWYKAHYFDYYDLSDARMLRSPMYETKVMNYLEKVAPQIPDSLFKEIDMLIAKSRSSDEIFRYMLVTLFNHYAKSQIMGFDAVQVYLAEKYYIPEATWSDSAYVKKLKEYVQKTKPLLINAPAPRVNFMLVPNDHFMQAISDTSIKRYPHVGQLVDLYNIKADYMVLFFWEPDCGHCKKLAPEMHKLVKTLKEKGVMVLSVGVVFGEEGKTKWIDFVNQKGLYDWTNAWNPYEADYKIKYNIDSTPQLFVLDKDKRIQAKRIAPDQLMEIIDMLMKRDEYLKNHPEKK